MLALRDTTRKPDTGHEGEDAHIRIERERAQGEPSPAPPAAPPGQAQLLCRENRHHKGIPMHVCLAPWSC